MSNLYKIVDKKEQLIKFKRNKAQEHFNANKHTRNIILKSRRLGFTTYESLDMLDDTLFTPNFSALMLSYDIPSQLDIFDQKILLAWQNIPDDIRPLWNMETDRSNQLKFGHGEGVFSSLSVRTKGRSGTYRRVHISEFGKICHEDPRKAKEIISGTIQAVPIDGRVDIESTAEGEFGDFHDMFWEAWERGEPKRPVDFKAHFYNWQYDDEIDLIEAPEKDLPKDFVDYQKLHSLTDIEITYYYYKWLSLNKDWDMLHQEYPTTPEEAFVSSGRKLFSVEKLGAMPQEQGETIGNWIYYAPYVPGHRYAMGADPGEGVGRDGSAIAIIDFDWRENRRIVPKVVAEFFSNKVDPVQFAHEIAAGGKGYGNCVAGVERNSVGLAVLTKLRDIYFNIYTEEVMDKMANQMRSRMGWHTNVATKPKMLYDLKTAIDNDDILIPSKFIVRELRTYDADDLSQIRFDEEQPSHWDRVIALAIAYQMSSHAMPSEKLRDDDDVDFEILRENLLRDALEKHDIAAI